MISSVKTKPTCTDPCGFAKPQLVAFENPTAVNATVTFLLEGFQRQDITGHLCDTEG